MTAILSLLAKIGQITLTETAPLTHDQKIADIHSRLMTIPAWGFQLIVPLLIIATVGIVLVWLRQTKIARNQVDLAKFIEEKIRK